MISADDLHKEWMKNPKYVEEYEKLHEEFEIAREFIRARIQAGLTQEELANKMQTKQSVISRLESGKSAPTLATLRKFAEVTGLHLKISFEKLSHA